MFNNIYAGSRVLITGNTGFKGAWLSFWLEELGATVGGYSLGVPSTPSIFESAKVADHIAHYDGDVCDLARFKAVVHEFRPDFIFHLAAQAIVSTSYADPVGTMMTNFMGTVNVLEAVREIDWECNVIMITSDKCYENVEWEWGYKETDHLGGKDVYSASKGAAEVAIHSYFHSFLKSHPSVRIASARAGNVIGGGDWAKDRIVVDCMRSWSREEVVEIRSPNATRPWQHVLEPLSGYLTLGAALKTNPALGGEPFNFGPRSGQNKTVLDLISDLSRHWHSADDEKMYRVADNARFHEAGLLKLNCDKALHHLKWEANLTYEQCVDFVGTWYAKYYQNGTSAAELCRAQIADYVALAKQKNLIWVS